MDVFKKMLWLSFLLLSTRHDACITPAGALPRPAAATCHGCIFVHLRAASRPERLLLRSLPPNTSNHPVFVPSTQLFTHTLLSPTIHQYIYPHTHSHLQAASCTDTTIYLAALMTGLLFVFVLVCHRRTLC